MDSRQVEAVSKKMKPSEIMLDLIPIDYFNSSGNKSEDVLAITTDSIYFLHNNSLKKTVPIADVRAITLSLYSRELVLHCGQLDLRLSSHQNAKILRNILKVREKVLKQNGTFTVMLEKEQSLGKFVQETRKSGFWAGLFHSNKEEGRSSRSSLSSRSSVVRLQVTDKTFLGLISRHLYQQRYTNVALLYINGNHGFFFDEREYSKRELGDGLFLCRHTETKELLLLRKIAKSNEDNNRPLRRYLEHFRLNSYKEEILYALQSDKYFEVVVPYNEKQRDLESLLADERAVSEIDMVSIFYTMMGLIDGEITVLHALRPKHVITKNDTIVVASAACLDVSNTNPAYLAPEELDPVIVDAQDAELINFWKIGVLLYEVAFLTLPFPIEYLAQVVARNKTLKLTFPASTRSTQLKQFIGEILEVDASRRGGGAGWKKRIFDHKWLKQSMR